MNATLYTRFDDHPATASLLFMTEIRICGRVWCVFIIKREPTTDQPTKLPKIVVNFMIMKVRE